MSTNEIWIFFSFLQKRWHTIKCSSFLHLLIMKFEKCEAFERTCGVMTSDLCKEGDFLPATILPLSTCSEPITFSCVLLSLYIKPVESVKKIKLKNTPTGCLRGQMVAQLDRKITNDPRGQHATRPTTANHKGKLLRRSLQQIFTNSGF